MNIKPDRTVGSIVAEDYRAAATFSRHRINYCCRGGLSFQEACKQNDLDPDQVLEAIRTDLANSAEAAKDEREWELDDLARYVETVHHRYVEERGPMVKRNLAQLCEVYGMAHPELIEVQQEFNACFGGMVMHMKKEELMLFPYVCKLVESQRSGASVTPRRAPLEGSIAKLLDDHSDEGDRFDRIRAITNNYALPEDGDATYAATFNMLKEFEADLYRHVHLENNILFPRAIELEKALAPHVSS